MKVLVVLGTRPEAIKLAPVVAALRAEGADCIVCSTGQHREMLSSVLRAFDLTPDVDLGLMRPGQDLTHVTSSALQGVGEVIDRTAPDWVVVQGDTTTAFAAALAAFYRKAGIAHVEAGLRTGALHSPWPEEANRKLIGQIASLHFAPTQRARENLLREGVADAMITVTGNTAIDALHWMLDRIRENPSLVAEVIRELPALDPGKRLVLVTGHRRENFDAGLANICTALRRLSERGDVEILYPVHLNPRVQEVAGGILSGLESVHLIQPVGYVPFVWLMQQAYLIVTDSGGIQEEAPTVRKPVLVTRDTTERPEAVAAGTARLVGTQEDAIFAAACELLDHEESYARMTQGTNPFGDGKAAARIAKRLVRK